MRKILKAFQSFTILILSRANSSLLEWLESLIALSNGKGFGTDSINREVKFFCKALKSVEIDSPVLMDIGGNIGDWSLEFKRMLPRSEIHVLEPNSSAFNQLSLNTKNLSDVKIYNLAVDENPGIRQLYFDKPASGMASFYDRNLEHFGIENTASELVKCVNLNLFLEQEGIKANCLKIDIEGHELAVLNSISEIHAIFKVILFEFGGCNIDSRTYFQDFWYFFANNNYRLFRVSPSGARWISNYNETLEHFRTTNYIAVAQQ
jgi:FkbM family methyltransferase